MECSVQSYQQVDAYIPATELSLRGPLIRKRTSRRKLPPSTESSAHSESFLYIDAFLSELEVHDDALM